MKFLSSYLTCVFYPISHSLLFQVSCLSCCCGASEWRTEIGSAVGTRYKLYLLCCSVFSFLISVLCIHFKPVRYQSCALVFICFVQFIFHQFLANRNKWVQLVATAVVSRWETSPSRLLKSQDNSLIIIEVDVDDDDELISRNFPNDFQILLPSLHFAVWAGC